MKLLMFLLILFTLITTSCTRSEKVTERGFDYLDGRDIIRIELDFDFIKDSLYNVDAVKAWNGIGVHYYADDTVQFISYSYSFNQSGLEIMAEREGIIDVPKNFDFENYVMFRTYGRKLVALECMKNYNMNNGNQEPKHYRFIVTFSEEFYDDKVFFYKIDKKLYFQSDMESYIIKDGERIFLGWNILEINGIDTGSGG